MKDGPAYGSQYVDALTFAAELHAGQVRKGTPVPYISHLLSVSSLVWEAGGDEGQAIAALLHDAVEDQGGAGTRSEISRRYGARVARIVDVCSDTDQSPKPPWKERKKAHLKLVKSTKLKSALLVIAADKLHNASCLLDEVRAHGEPVWDRFNGGKKNTLWYYRKMHKVLAQRMPDSPLVARLGTVVKQLTKEAGKTRDPAKDPAKSPAASPAPG